MIEHFYFEDQCEKIEAFKNALRWLAKKAGLDKEDKKQKELKELRAQADEILTRISKLEHSK